VKKRETKSLRSCIHNRMKKNAGGGVDDLAALEQAQLAEMEAELEAAVPEDTYPNVEDPEALAASQLGDEEVEEDYFSYVVEEVLTDEEASYLQQAISADPDLEAIVEKVIVAATEFSGSGMVEGEGDGTSDSIPARLSDGEFVMTKKATDQIGPENLQSMMDEAERAYDGGLMRKAGGGLIRDEGKLPLQDEINRLMIGSNKMSSM